MTEGAPRIDAHLHVWDLEVSDYGWLGPQHGRLHTSWTPQQAAVELRTAGMHGAVLVQAEDSHVDTAYLLDVATRCRWVRGVVGWVPLDDPRASAEALDRWSEHPAFCGVRHLINDDPRENFLELPAVRNSLADLAARGLPFDLHDAWPRHLDQAERLAEEIPSLTLVVDHLGKPPREPDAFAAWRLALARVARHSQTVAKFSGLWSVSGPYSVDALRGVWEIALDLFGPDRLMYGGDWPITELNSGYQPTWQVVDDLAAELSESERSNVLGGTAARIYHLPPNDWTWPC
ncbi:amidohydrolase [Cryobacterium sp. Hb1]|uniref:amidohydrolase family protein n=1 Tax=Cryobacterium sp. Hb1 TaxID=1259147 RepID=UPI00106B4F07|nr:amidohydrolase family protein [Cryobacterium sp. Hb1]TFD69142.1 hydrolase [Cryobacterium sp. Hb1]